MKNSWTVLMCFSLGVGCADSPDESSDVSMSYDDDGMSVEPDLLAMDSALDDVDLSDMDMVMDAGQVDSGTARVEIDVTTRTLSPPGGFVSAVKFSADGERLYLSGDDASGLYQRASDASRWELMAGVPLDWSAYQLALWDEGATLVAPNHFGRGLLVSRDRGLTFEHTELPQGSGFVWDVALGARQGTPDPYMWLATDGGVWCTTDWGESFARAIFEPELFDTVHALVHVPHSEHLYAGTSQGGLYLSVDHGASFDALILAEPDNPGVTDMSATTHALYIGYLAGYTAKLPGFEIDAIELNLTPAWTSSLWTRVIARSGPAADQDTVWLGTVEQLGASAPHGLFLSTDSGGSFVHRPMPEQASVFSLAMHPDDPDHLLIGTLNGPVLETRDAGETFIDLSQNVSATAALAVTRHQDDARRFALSSTTLLPGTGSVHLSEDAGESWQRLEALDQEDVLALSFFGETLLAGASGQGVLRSQDGGKSFERVLPIDSGIRRFDRAPDGSSILAIPDYTIGVSNIQDAALYRSVDEGQSWSISVATLLALDIERSSRDPSHVAVAGLGVYLFDEDDQALQPREVGLSSNLEENVVVSALGLGADEPGMILAGDSQGALWRTTGCEVGQQDVCVWEELPSPVPGLLVTGLESTMIEGRRVWLLSAWAGDLVEPGAAPGLWLTEDDGTSWRDLRQQMWPSSLAWNMSATSDSGQFVLGRWGGGGLLVDLSYRQRR